MWAFQPLVPAAAQLQATPPAEPKTTFNNYLFVRVGNGMSTGERIK